MTSAFRSCQGHISFCSHSLNRSTIACRPAVGSRRMSLQQSLSTPWPLSGSPARARPRSST
eukprot:3787069-Pyramimonas_sp.AAC.1